MGLIKICCTLTHVGCRGFPRMNSGCDEHHFLSHLWQQIVGRSDCDKVKTLLLLQAEKRKSLLRNGAIIEWFYHTVAEKLSTKVISLLLLNAIKKSLQT